MSDLFIFSFRPFRRFINQWKMELHRRAFSSVSTERRRQLRQISQPASALACSLPPYPTHRHRFTGSTVCSVCVCGASRGVEWGTLNWAFCCFSSLPLLFSYAMRVLKFYAIPSCSHGA